MENFSQVEDFMLECIKTLMVKFHNYMHLKNIRNERNNMVWSLYGKR